MIYREAIPKPSLQSIINCFWMIESDDPVTVSDRTFPDGCQEIIFNIGTQVLRNDGKGFSRNPSVELVGQMTRPYDVMTQGRQCFFGIKFFPHSFSLFTGESIHDLRDQSIDLGDLFPDEIEAVVSRTLEQVDFNRFVQDMEVYFSDQLKAMDAPRRSYPLVEHGVRIMFSQDEVTVNALAQALGGSERYLQQAFRHHIGLTPKQLWKMVRFQRSFRYLHHTAYSLTDIAHRCGYYDQAHFTRDFNVFAGMSPSSYRNMKNPLNGFFLSETSRAYLCNYSL